MKEETLVMFNGGGGSYLGAPERFLRGCQSTKVCYNSDVTHHNYNEVCMKKIKTYSAFTLAEMMVVMLILSIVMAAFAPVMTTRSKTDRTSPWRYSADNSNIYFGLGDNQTAMIGQPAKNQDIDPSTRLIINTSNDNQKHITFKRGQNNVEGNLHLSNGGILLGDLDNGTLENGSVGIGHGVTLGGADSISIGRSSSASNEGAIAIGSASANDADSIAIGIGTDANAKYTTALGGSSGAMKDGATAIGYQSTASGENSTAIGEYARAEAAEALSIHSIATGKSSTAIGYGRASNEFSIMLAPGKSTGGGENKSESTGYAATAIGSNTHAKGGYSVAIGTGAATNSDSALSIGPGTNTTGTGSIAIGDGAKTYRLHGIAIGTDAKTGNGSSSVWGDYSIAIGKDAKAGGDANVSIGYNAGSAQNSGSNNNVALGRNACENVRGSNKTCIGAYSGPSFSDSVASDDSKYMYLGTSDTNVYIPGNLIVGGNVALATNRRSSIYARLRTNGDYWYSFLEMTEGNNAQTVKQSGWYRTQYDVSYNSAFLSDRRLKYVGKEFTSGLDKIKQLKVFNYTFKEDKSKTPHVGVMAQDLQKIFPDAVKKGADGYLTIRLEDMFYAIINAIKELDNSVTHLSEAVKNYTKILNQVQNDNKKLQQENEALRQKNLEFETRLRNIEKQLK